MADQRSRSLPEPLRSGAALPVLFAILAFVAATGVVFALGGSIDHLLRALAGGIVTALVVIGVYYLGRRYGQPHSHATASAGVSFGIVLLAAVVTEVLLSSDMVSIGEIAVGLMAALIVVVILTGMISAVDRATAT